MDHGEAHEKEMEDDDDSHSSPHSEQSSAHDSDNPKERDDDEDDVGEDDDSDDDHDHDHDGGGGEEARLTRRNSVTIDSGAGDKKTEASAAAATVAPAPGGDGSGGGDVSRPLLDSIRQEHEANAVTPANIFAINRNSFKDRLPVRRPGPISDPELVVSVRPSPSIIARSISRAVSIRNTEATYPESAAATGRAAFLSEFNPSHIGSAAEQEENNDAADHNGSSIFGGAAEAPAGNEEQPVRVSLMALLGQTDGEWGDGSPSESPMGGDDEDEEDDEDAEEENGSGMEYECCVCMVRHKGSAFIPCGHTFCRLCSRELWVSRGNCPLCNGYILEILDIF